MNETRKMRYKERNRREELLKNRKISVESHRSEKHLHENSLVFATGQRCGVQYTLISDSIEFNREINRFLI